ncbi:MAG: ABC transporter ATP-binding protein [Desulfobacteraceae bacterium]|nr:ABC transporter ATP-binding protein [Desulfobacteraceae bacterium]
MKQNNSDYYEKHIILSVQNVHLTLGESHILDDVTLEIRDIRQPGAIRGQIRGLIGPSGVGKTQLLRVIAGLIQPDQGKVEAVVDEKDTLYPVKAGTVGVVAQHYPLFEHLTVLENLVLAAKVSRVSVKKAKNKAYDLLNRFELHERADFWPSQLSGGQRQRVAILQQLMVERFFLIMDEPFSGLDPNAVNAVIKFVNEVAHSHELNTIIIISHDIRSVVTIADRIHILGRDFDKTGNIVRGAHITEEIDLLELGIAWKDNIKELPEFNSLVNEIEDKFTRI